METDGISFKYDQPIASVVKYGPATDRLGEGDKYLVLLDSDGRQVLLRLQDKAHRMLRESLEAEDVRMEQSRHQAPKA